MTLKELRKSLNLTQGQFAESIGICLSAVSKLENGLSKLPLKIKNRIEQTYHVEIDELEIECYSSLKTQIEQLKQENAELKKQIRLIQLTKYSAQRAEKLFNKLGEVYGWKK